MSIDPFEARLQFLKLLRSLNASQQSIQAVVRFAVKYGSRCGEDLWECVMEESAKVPWEEFSSACCPVSDTTTSIGNAEHSNQHIVFPGQPCGGLDNYRSTRRSVSQLHIEISLGTGHQRGTRYKGRSIESAFSQAGGKIFSVRRDRG